MYTLAIYLYMLCANVASLFSRKVRLLMRGHHDAWRTLRQSIGEGEYYWFHAASLGEFEQGRPLMERLRREHPETKILLTFFSPSGYEVRKNYPVADVVCYLPFDTPANARKFVRLARPRALFLIKYEFWRNYIHELHRHGIPVYSVSSIFREGQIFFRPYGRGYAGCLRRITHFFVQNEASVGLLRSIGISPDSITVAGDTRFDRVLDIQAAAKPLPLVERFADGRTLLVAGSSWPPDEDIIIDYFNRTPGLFLILAPHVVSEDHLREIEGKLRRPALRYTHATEDRMAGAHCLIIDCYGLLSSIYRYGRIAYIGGGFGVGIHNVTEAAVYGIPVIIGPNNGKFREARDLIDCGGCTEIHGAADFDAVVDRYLAHPEQAAEAGRAAGAYISDNAGAADIVYHAVFQEAGKE